MENQNLENKSDCQCDNNCQCGEKCTCSSSNKLFMTILLVVIAVLLGSAGLYFYFQNKDSQNNTLAPEINITTNNDDYEIPGEEDYPEYEMEEEETISEEPLPLNDAPVAIFYNNSDYGFSLTFPSTWNGYFTTERTLTWGAPIGNTNSLDFGFLAQDSIFNISIFTHQQWTDLQNMEGPTPGYLGENSQYVFAHDTAQFAANAEMTSRRSEVSGILETIRINQ
jgi:hypothetical protein